MLLIYFKEQGELEVLYLDSFDVATGIPKSQGNVKRDCQKVRHPRGHHLHGTYCTTKPTAEWL